MSLISVKITAYKIFNQADLRRILIREAWLEGM